MNTEVDLSADYIDVRDIIARVEELREERADLVTDAETAQEELEAASLPVKNLDTGEEECDSSVSDEERAELKTAQDEAQNAVSAWDDENGEELKTLEGILSELRGYGGDEQWEGDWYPVTLIRDSYFTEAMKELCEDIGDFPNGLPGYYVIDWDATALNLRVDYSSVTVEGETYWYR